jgi:hypothetical protein
LKLLAFLGNIRIKETEFECKKRGWKAQEGFLIKVRPWSIGNFSFFGKHSNQGN